MIPGAQVQTETARIRISESGVYDRYVRAEWTLFSNDPGRSAAAREAVAGLSISRVLDIGCGAGQELRPFLRGTQSLGVGIDVSPEVGIAGRELFAADQPDSRVAYLRAAAERLPFSGASFDLVICRLALPYTDNAQALREMARVLRPGGALLLKFHHARYYALKLREALASGLLKSAIHACRVLVAGTLYHITGLQPRGRLTGRETFQSMWLLRRELRRDGLEIRRVLEDSVPAAPSLLIVRAGPAWSATVVSD
jgi:ubiquinone/menaquinone biosynthesis C-methylase UbiE